VRKEASTSAKRQQLYVRIAILIAYLVGTVVFLIGLRMPADGSEWVFTLRLALQQIGATILVSGTIGIVLTEGYKLLRGLTVTDEVYGLVDRLRTVVSRPEEFSLFQLKSYLDQAGVLAFYPDRLGPAEDDLLACLQELIQRRGKTTIYLIGDTLRVFFFAQLPFTWAINQIISENPKITFRVLMLNPNCMNFLYRSEAETPSAPFKTDDEYHRSLGFVDSRTASNQIHNWNNNPAYLQARNGRHPIDLRFYDCVDYCLAVILPDVSFTAQYIYSDAEAQTNTPRLPMLKFAKKSVGYERMLRNFNWIWENHFQTEEEVEESLRSRPVVAWRNSLRAGTDPSRSEGP